MSSNTRSHFHNHRVQPINRLLRNWPISRKILGKGELKERLVSEDEGAAWRDDIRQIMMFLKGESGKATLVETEAKNIKWEINIDYIQT